jgi:GntR family transcriptional repressor for pyruvate dehydrogenase complex
MMDAADRSTLVDDTANKIRQMVFGGQLQPGELLPSRKELAEQFDVGISTIHEAIKSLAAVGLVDSRPGKGTWIRHDALDVVLPPSLITSRFGQIDVESIYEARLMLEVTLAELAAQRATPEDVAAMWAALEASQAVMADDEAFMKADWDFHMAVAKAARNVLIESFYHLSRQLLREFIQDAISLPGVREEASQLHIQQAKAIEQHDVERARQIALDHMLYVKERMML